MKILTLFLFLVHVTFAVTADTTPSEPHISVTGQHKISTVPDILRLSLSLIDIGQDVEEVSQLTRQRTAKLITNLKSLGISKKDITSSHLSIVPHYNWKNREQVYVGTEVSRNVEVILRDLTKYDELLRTILSAKIGRINSTSLESSKEKTLRKQAFQAAVEDAREQAKLLVSNIPEKIGSVYSIDHQSSGPVNVRSRALYRTREATQNSFEPGIIEFSESVKVIYYLSR